MEISSYDAGTFPAGGDVLVAISPSAGTVEAGFDDLSTLCSGFWIIAGASFRLGGGNGVVATITCKRGAKGVEAKEGNGGAGRLRASSRYPTKVDKTTQVRPRLMMMVLVPKESLGVPDLAPALALPSPSWRISATGGDDAAGRYEDSGCASALPGLHARSSSLKRPSCR